MATGFGYLNVCGIGAESTYDTEVAATQRVPLLNTDLDDQLQLYPVETLEGRVNMRPPDAGHIISGGTLSTNLRYTLANLLLQHGLGTLSAARYTMANTRENLGLTIAIDKGVSPVAFRGCKVTDLTLTSELERVMLDATIRNKTIVRPSTTNTAAVLAALANGDTTVLHRHLNFRIGDLVDALVSGDEVGVSSLTWSLTRAVDEVWTNQAQTIIQPLDNARPEMTLQIVVPRHTTDQYKTWQNAGTTLQARAFWQSGSRSIELLLMALTIQDAPVPTPGAELLSTTVTLMATEGLTVDTATTFSASSVDNSYNDSGSGLDFVIAPAQIHVTGFATAANNGVKDVTSRTTSKIIVSQTLVTEAAGPSVVIRYLNPSVVINEL